MLSDPQRFNLYVYVRNSPLNLVDPTGEAIELTGDENERERTLALLRQIVGGQAGAYLYENKGRRKVLRGGVHERAGWKREIVWKR